MYFCSLVICYQGKIRKNKNIFLILLKNKLKMTHSVLYKKLPEVKRLLKENKVERAYVFGSVCTENFKDESDIDFLISFDKNIDPIEYGDNYFKILYALQKLLQRDVDLVAEETLTNPYFIKVMNKTKTTIYE